MGLFHAGMLNSWYVFDSSLYPNASFQRICHQTSDNMAWQHFQSLLSDTGPIRRDRCCVRDGHEISAQAGSKLDTPVPPTRRITIYGSHHTSYRRIWGPLCPSRTDLFLLNTNCLLDEKCALFEPSSLLPSDMWPLRLILCRNWRASTPICTFLHARGTPKVLCLVDGTVAVVNMSSIMSVSSGFTKKITDSHQKKHSPLHKHGDPLPRHR